eukprot:CAMPEP_0170222500 /NCGR_PEP_ID=MMETSP0116_2-20130129/10945_1 /TAXON_ID=400756 /ORGANISM="Durinskia baltica, Strain CSIRO CS-38" /LENGTH=456 /DNA_ID=CAMNT_0010473193 /DNA_START=147 /DNA_END=1517 /DNA_ORIENTATION=+
MASLAAIVFLAGFGAAGAQQAGTVVAEAQPPMPLQFCTTAEGCAAEPAAVTLDANWRWVHAAGGYENCFTEGRWSEKHCPNGHACASKCAVEGVDAEGYAKTYGVKSIPTGLELQFVSSGGNVGSRVYLTDGAESYKLFKLKNREFSFEADVSSLACGLNGALYFVEMDVAGGKGKGNNTAGAKFGTGYCDAQCPKDVKWMHGQANIDGERGMCCFEMDIWEANRMATAFTTHPCAVEGAFACSGMECGDGAKGERYLGVCDKDGCDMNGFRMGAQSHYGVGPEFEVDSNKPMKVVTQFLTTDGTDAGDLAEIRRLYVQDGKVIAHADSAVPGVPGNSITDEFCSAQKAAFGDPDDHKAKGGLKKMGEALDRGLVLALSLWDDAATEMRWLDSSFPPDVPAERLGVMRGPCDGSANNPTYLRTTHASASVKYMNIMYGEIGSTFQGDARRLSPLMV